MKEHIKNVVLVHGAFADGSGWEAVANILKNDGYKVSVAQPPRPPTPRTKSTPRPPSTPWADQWFWWVTVMGGRSSPRPAIIQTLRRLSILPHSRSMKVRAVRRSNRPCRKRPKTVWLEIDERGEVVWHPVFLDFARYWGFQPRLCRPYRAQTKGKVESGVKYVRRNFLCGNRPRSRQPHRVSGDESAVKYRGT